MNLKETIRTVPNWPIEGVMFRDITPLMKSPEALRKVCDIFFGRYQGYGGG